jgi:hypothetical protein
MVPAIDLYFGQVDEALERLTAGGSRSAGKPRCPLKAMSSSGTGLLAAGSRALLPAVVPRLPAPGRAHQAPLTFRFLRNGR